MSNLIISRKTQYIAFQSILPSSRLVKPHIFPSALSIEEIDSSAYFYDISHDNTILRSFLTCIETFEIVFYLIEYRLKKLFFDIPKLKIYMHYLIVAHTERFGIVRLIKQRVHALMNSLIVSINVNLKYGNVHYQFTVRLRLMLSNELCVNLRY